MRLFGAPRFAAKRIGPSAHHELTASESVGVLPGHLKGVPNYCRPRMAMGVVEAINSNVTTLQKLDRGSRNHPSLLLKAGQMAVARTEFVTRRKAA